jgi:hypothetical protein
MIDAELEYFPWALLSSSDEDLTAQGKEGNMAGTIS